MTKEEILTNYWNDNGCLNDIFDPSKYVSGPDKPEDKFHGPHNWRQIEGYSPMDYPYMYRR